MTDAASAQPPFFDRKIALGLASAVLLLHIAVNFVTPYEFHRDEFLYFAMGAHLRLWHMDFPPFIAIVAKISRALFGVSLPGLRFAPAVSHAILVGCASWCAFAFGGRRSAQALAALTVATSGLMLRPGAMFQPVTFDQLWWTLALVALIMRIRDDDPKHWIGIGVFLGLGALTKFSIAFITIGFVVAVIATPLRRDVGTRWPWLALMIAIVIGHPSIVGQIALGWPVRDQMRALQSSQLTHVGPFDFLRGQLSAGPIVVLGGIGIVWLWSTRYCAISIATGVAFLVLLATRGKAYYIGPIYPVLCAAGAAAISQFGFKLVPRRPTAPLALAAATVALFGVIALPFGLPILEPHLMAQYASGSIASTAARTNQGVQLAIPQDYADMLGWNALVDTVARVWNDLPPAEQAQTVLIGNNYGRAGALELLGPSRGLPPVVSTAGSFWFFGPGTRAGNTAIVVGTDEEDMKKFFGEYNEAARTYNPMGVPEERVVRIFLSRKPFATLQQVWPKLAGQN